MPRVMDVAKVNGKHAKDAIPAKDAHVAKGDASRDMGRSNAKGKGSDARDRMRDKIAKDVLAKQETFALAYEAALTSLSQARVGDAESKAREIALDVAGLREALDLVSKYDFRVKFDRKGFAIEDTRNRDAKLIHADLERVAKRKPYAHEFQDASGGDLASRLVTGESWDAPRKTGKVAKRDADYRTPEALLGYMRSLVNFARAISGNEAQVAASNLAGQLAFIREGGLQPFCAFDVTEELVDRLCKILEHEAANPTSVKGRMRFEEVAVYIPKRKDSRASVWAMDMATRLMVRLES